MRKYLLIIMFILPAVCLSAQKDSLRLSYVIRGTVTDGRSGRPLETVHISIPDRHYATVTNADGGFTIKSDAPIPTLVFTYVGYKTLRQDTGTEPMKVRLFPEALLLDEASIVSGDPKQIVQIAIGQIRDNYCLEPELLECFYRETLRKRQRYTYVSEAVTRLYKAAYDGSVFRDKAALEKSRVLLSQRRSDTLSVKVQGGPTQALTFDLVKNNGILFNDEELSLYRFEMGPPAYIDDRLQFVVHLSPGYKDVEYALYNGTLYIDRELLTFTRIELSLDMSDPVKATRQILVSKPFSLRFIPKELSLAVNYRLLDGKIRLGYFRSTIRFNCDWRKRLFKTGYTAVNELVVTDVREPAVPVSRNEAFKTKDILSDKAAEFQDPDFWKDYNIIEPSESLEHAIGRLRKKSLAK